MVKKAAKKSAEAEPMKLFYIFYNQERWDNWITRLHESSFEPGPDPDEMPEGFRVLYSFGMDVTLSVLKIIKLYQNERFSKEETLDRLSQVEKIVLSDPPAGDLTEVVESLQLSLLVLFASCKKFLDGNFGTDLKVLVKEGRAKVENEMEAALDIAAEIGANVIKGASCCGKFVKDDLEQPSLFDEWLIECEAMNEAMTSLKNFDEVAGEED